MPAPTPIRLKVITRPAPNGMYGVAPTPRIDLTGHTGNGGDECPHELLNADGACMACGVVCQTLYNNDHGYTTSHSMPRQNERSILKELEALALPDDIKAKADRIYQELENGTRRGAQRKRLVFFCIYQAYHQLGYRKDPYELARLVGITNGDVTKAISAYSDYRPSIQKVTEYSPVEFVPQFCDALSLSEELKDRTVFFAQGIVDKDPDLLDRTPRAVAVGIIYYYLTVIVGAVVDAKQFAQAVGMSEVTVNKAYKTISDSDNGSG